MTVKQAIEILNMIPPNATTEEVEARIMAIRALNLTIPKSVTYCNQVCNPLPYGKCGRCGNTVNRKEVYCDKCGGKLLWED